jgi:UDP-GlcNAc:undecaprenyl-phosphate/decaprenyl-phosphate GlcNAc-1-phosphate transferase
LIDTLRVFVLRTLKGKSPFSADKNHIHHKLLSLGMSHKQVTLVLYLYSIGIVVLTFFMPKHTPNISFLVVGGIGIVLTQALFLIKKKKKKPVGA